MSFENYPVEFERIDIRSCAIGIKNRTSETRGDRRIPSRPCHDHLHLKEQPTVPLEAEVLSPDVMAELSNDEIRALTVYHGKRQLPLGEFFDVEGETSDDLVIHGDVCQGPVDRPRHVAGQHHRSTATSACTSAPT